MPDHKCSPQHLALIRFQLNPNSSRAIASFSNEEAQYELLPWEGTVKPFVSGNVVGR